MTEVHSVTGRYDLIVRLRVPDAESIADVVPAGINRVPGVIGSETIIAFRAYAADELDAGFALGQDPD